MFLVDHFLVPCSFLFLFLSTSILGAEIPIQELPDVANKTEILALAELAGNAYIYPDQSNASVWRNTTGLYHYMDSYGWNVDGLRGHVFTHVSRSVLVISVKGTSLSSAEDKNSANLICSCNCCSTYECSGEKTCNGERLSHALPTMYLSLLIDAYNDVLLDYPGRDVWFTGHSMGAVIASLAAMMTCNPGIGFAAPGEQLFANRIGLRHGNCPSTIYHFGYYNDPIFNGQCGWLCSMAGYHMDSQCHHGHECVYGPAEADGSGSGAIRSHGISFLIDNVIAPRETVPTCDTVVKCTETCTSMV